jgi:isopentenyldiphosphate isomerase
MAKSLKDTLKLGPRVEFKKTDKNIEATEKAVAQIHEPETPTEETPKIVERIVEKIVYRAPEPEPIVEAEITKRVTLDIPLSLHAEIKMNTFRKGLTIKDYLLELAKKDLGL